MKTRLLLCFSVALAWPTLAQNDAGTLTNQLPFPLVAPAQAEKLAVPQNIKLDLNGVTLAAALDELQKQSGVALFYQTQIPSSALSKMISVHLETRSFHRAFDEIMDEAGVTASLDRLNYNWPWRVVFDQSEYGASAPQSQSGLFRARLTRLDLVRLKAVFLDDEAGEPNRRVRSDDLRVTLTLLPDERLPGVGLSQTRFTRAEDDKGRSLLPADPNPNRQFVNRYNFYDHGIGHSVNNAILTLAPPASDAGTLAHLEGVAVYALVTKPQVWQVPDVLAQQEWKRSFQDGAQKFDVTLAPQLKDEKTIAVNIEVNSSQSASESQIPPPMMSPAAIVDALQIVDANGAIYVGELDGSDSVNGEPKIKVTARFYRLNNDNDDKPSQPLALPVKLIFNAPLGVVQTEAPFSFENLPLP